MPLDPIASRAEAKRERERNAAANAAKALREKKIKALNAKSAQKEKEIAVYQAEKSVLDAAVTKETLQITQLSARQSRNEAFEANALTLIKSYNEYQAIYKSLRDYLHANTSADIVTWIKLVRDFWGNRGMEPAYKNGTKIIEFETKAADSWVRVHGHANQARPWMMREVDIEGLSGKQIAEKFNIKDIPTVISKVDVPAGTTIRVGTVGRNSFGAAEEATQFEILMERVPPEWFTKIGSL